MEKIQPVFKSVYARKFGEFKIFAVDRFGIKFLHTTKTKDERDELKLKWKKNLTAELPPVAEAHEIKQRRATKKLIDPIRDYYMNVCEGCGLKYVIENFTAKMLNDNGDCFSFAVLKGDKVEYVDELPVAKFYLMNKWQKDHLHIDENQIDFWKSYRYVRGYYLVVFLPKIKFRNNQIAFDVRVPYGQEIKYGSAKRIWEKLDSIGFNTFEISFSDIPKDKHYRRIAIDEHARRVKAEQLKILERQRKHISKIKVDRILTEPVIYNPQMKVKTAKYYRVQNSIERLSGQFGRSVDRSIWKERKQRELNQLLNYSRSKNGN